MKSSASPASASPRRVLVVADDVLPRPEERARAAGMRAWAMGEGLRANGLTVRYAVRTQWWGARPLPPSRDFEDYWNDPAGLERILHEADPHVVVNCSYPSLLPQAATERLLVQDVNGPRILECAYRDPASLRESAWREASAYASADYFVCGGERQLSFFYPWLVLSGFDVTDTARCGVVRLGLTGAPPERSAAAGRLLAAGTALPWTDPRRGWRIAAEEASRQGGVLRILFSREEGGRATGPDRLAEEVDRLRQGEGCEVRPAVSWAAFADEMAGAAAALDVMERNPERELAVPTRTLSYLWAGLPPILADHGDLGELIARHDAGWAVPASDDAALRVAVREALGAPDVVARKSANARRLHESLLAPPVATRALASLCFEGTTRVGKRSLPAGSLRRRLAQEAARIARTFGEGPGFGGAG